MAVLSEVFGFTDRLEIHFSISAVQEWELARQSIAEQKARDLTRLINFGQGEPRKFQSRGRATRRDLGFDFVPTIHHFAPKLFIAARALHLIEDELFIFSTDSTTCPSLLIFFASALLASRRRWKLNQTIHPRQDRDAVWPRSKPMSERACFAPDAVRFLKLPRARAPDPFC